jgi:acylphosphatase
MIIRGRVQGVGFRYFVMRRAGNLGLHGWVRNRPDGSVEVTAEGDETSLARLRQVLECGPSSARIDDIEEEWSEGPPRFQAFEITG